MIHRSEHTKNFTMLNNEILEDDLSDGAFRLLVFMLSCSDTWKFTLKGLAYCLGLSERTVSDRLAELKRSGYISQRRIINSKGQFEACEWDVYEDKLTTPQKNHSEVKPRRGKTTVRQNHTEAEPHCGKSAVIKQVPIITSTNINKEQSKQDKAQPFDALLSSLSPELRETFTDFIKMRKTIKAPLTEKALDLAIKKAFKLGKGDPEKIKAVVEQSILNSWKGLFELREEKQKTQFGEIDWDEVMKLAEGGSA